MDPVPNPQTIEKPNRFTEPRWPLEMAYRDHTAMLLSDVRAATQLLRDELAVLRKLLETPR